MFILRELLHVGNLNNALLLGLGSIRSLLELHAVFPTGDLNNIKIIRGECLIILSDETVSAYVLRLFACPKKLLQSVSLLEK
jgi:hypothetical protein